MARIPDQFIDELISRTDIAELIDQRVPLQRAGAEFRACCPFHNEKTPSFYVSPAKQFYHCFGCGAHGTSIGFLMEFDNMGFLDAVDTLASQVGMVVPKESRSDDQSRKKQTALHDVVEQAKRWYQTQLKHHTSAEHAIGYLKQRGIDGKTAAAFGIGFAPDGWSNLMEAVGSDPAQLQQLEDVGLIIKKDEGGYYDRFRSRLMFPIEDYRGKLVGFGGRVISKGEPKYLNSPETTLFHKGSELYGFHRARRAMGKDDEAVVVEGYMDVVGLAQCGIHHAVATLGTATTSTHLQRLFRAASKIIFCFDGDRAGRQAAWRALEVSLSFMQDGRQIRFLLMPEDEDPDSLIRKNGLDDFKQRLSEAVPLNSFLFDSLCKKLDMSQMDQRAKLATQARPLLNKLPQGNFKTMMFAHLSELVGVTQHQNETSSPETERRYAVTAGVKPQVKQSNNNFSKPVQRAISLIIQYPELVEIANEFEFPAPDALPGFMLMDMLIGMVNVRPNSKTAHLIEKLRDSQYSIVLSELATIDLMLEAEQRETYFRETLNKLEQQMVRHQIEDLLKQGLGDLSEQERDKLNALYKRKT